MIPQRLFEKLRCPKCHSEVKEHTPGTNENDLFCTRCNTEYQVLNNIPSLVKDDPEDVDWNTWKLDEINMAGNSYYKRAKGELQEKECSRSFAEFMLKNNLYHRKDEVLDFGCSCGHYLKSFREHLYKNILYTGIDSHMEFLQWGKKIFGVHEQVDFVHADALELPFLDNSFDVGIAQLFHFFQDTREILKEACRVTKKYLIWRTPVAHMGNYTVKIFFDKPYVELGNLTVDTKSQKHDIYNIFTPKYVKGLISEIGYKVIKVEKDDNFRNFDNTKIGDFSKQPSTKVVDRLQINGPLVLDWHFYVIDCDKK